MSNTRQSITNTIEAAGIVAVIRIKDPAKLQAIVDAISEGGITIYGTRDANSTELELTQLTAGSINLPNLVNGQNTIVIVNDDDVGLDGLDGTISIQTGGMIPGLSGRRTFVGHWAETLRSEEKIEELVRFFAAGGTDEERLAFFRRRGITHVFLGPSERRLGPFDPSTLPGARVLWEQGTVRLLAAP